MYIQKIMETIKEEQTQEDKIRIILGQTNYTEEECIKLLDDNNDDYMQVIRDFMGIRPKKEVPIKSVNQEIYKQLRRKLDIQEFNAKHPPTI